MAIGALAFSASTAFAATYDPVNVESNGNRPDAGGDQSGPATVIDPNPIGEGQNVGIAGRIVNAVDQWSFTTEVAWSISFVDLDIDDQAFFDSSDITNPPSGGGFNPAGNGDPTVAIFSILLESDNSVLYSTGPIAATAAGAGTEGLLDYTGVAGTYILKIDGSGQQGGNEGATYDIGISTVPVPAAGLLLMAGVGGLAALKRRRKKS